MLPAELLVMMPTELLLTMLPAELLQTPSQKPPVVQAETDPASSSMR